MDLAIEQPCKNCNKFTHKMCDQCVNLPVDQYSNVCSQFGRVGGLVVLGLTAL